MKLKFVVELIEKSARCHAGANAKQGTTQRYKYRKVRGAVHKLALPFVNDMCQEIVVLSAPGEIVASFWALSSCGHTAFAPLVQVP